MHCEVMDSAQLILKRQFKNVTVGLNSVFRTNVDFGKYRIPFIQNNVADEGFFVQLYNVEQHLFCAAGFYRDEEANISIYDSLNKISRLPQLVSLLSSQFKNTKVEISVEHKIHKSDRPDRSRVRRACRCKCSKCLFK